MKILSINAGSSSLKLQMYEMPEEKVLISGTFERIGIGGSFYTIKINGEKIKKEKELKNHSDAVETLIQELLDNKESVLVFDIDGVPETKQGIYPIKLPRAENPSGSPCQNPQNRDSCRNPSGCICLCEYHYPECD